MTTITSIPRPAAHAEIPSMHLARLAPSSKIHIINGGQALGKASGKLCKATCERIEQWFTKNGHDVRITHIDEDSYDAAEEASKLTWADVVILQFPGFWMSCPWKTKKYIDEVFLQCHGVLYTGDGRSRHDQAKLYGSGGLAKDKLYMLSSTWNAPEGAMEPGHFYGEGVDGSVIHLHRPFQFLGMQAVPGFMMFDVIKNPKVEQDFNRLDAHLDEVFNGGKSRSIV